MVWSGPTIFGHVAIVTNIVLPANGNDGSITFAEANGPGSIINGQFVAGIVTQTLAPDLSVATWSGSQVVGYIRPNSVYVDLAGSMRTRLASIQRSSSDRSRWKVVSIQTQSLQRGQWALPSSSLQPLRI